MTLFELSQGEVLYDPKFVYSDDTSTCDKLLVVLNRDHVEPDDAIVVPCTSKGDVSALSPGCNSQERVFYVDTKIGFYDPPTIVQYEFLTNFDCDRLKDWIESGEITRLNKSLDPQELGQILNCLKQQKEDVPQAYYDSIF